MVRRQAYKWRGYSKGIGRFIVAMWLILYAVLIPSKVVAEVRAVATASNGMVVLVQDGTVISFRDPVNLKQAVQISGARDIIAVGHGPEQGLALRKDGRVLVWTEYCRAHSDIEVDCKFSPAQEVPGLTEVIAIAQGTLFSLALRRDGSLWGWGDDTYGQISGRPNEGEVRRKVSSPRRISLPGSVVSVAAGWRHSLVLLQDGRVMAWGTAPTGALGGGAAFEGEKGFRAVFVEGLPTVKQLAANTLSYALAADGHVWEWGTYDNGVHRFGKNVPTQLAGELELVEIAAGHGFAVGRNAIGSVFVWGSLDPRQFAQSGPRMIYAAIPTLVEAIPHLAHLSAYADGIAGVDEGGDVWAWGTIWIGPLLRKIKLN
jgi:alpha-tubulin suppressor-like RCC1 family protein